MTTGFWLLPEDSPCEFHTKQWNHSSSHNVRNPYTSTIANPWSFLGQLECRRLPFLKRKFHIASSPESLKRKTSFLDNDSFGFGCGVRGAGSIPPRNSKSFSQPVPCKKPNKNDKKRDLRWQSEHIILTSKHLPGRAPLPDKGKPAVRRGRKATDQISDLKAGLPEEE